MADAGTIWEVLKLYEKHGWVLRQVLLSEVSRADLAGSINELFGETRIKEFPRDAAWFSRASGQDKEAWELRLFSEAPFALVEVFGPEQDEDEREEFRGAIEERMLETDPAKMAREPVAE